MKTLILRMTKMVNALKGEPIQRNSANNYTSMCHFFGFDFMPLRKKTLLFWSDIFHSLSFFHKCFDDRSWEIGTVIKPPLDTRKKTMIIIFNVLLLLKLEIYCMFTLYFNTKIKRISAREEAKALFSHHHEH
jgi:hypothetical protein